jgi:hypothetical protein
MQKKVQITRLISASGTSLSKRPAKKGGKEVKMILNRVISQASKKVWSA